MRKIAVLSIGLTLLILVFVSAKKDKNDDFFKDPKGFVFIPMGSAEIDGKTMTFQAFYISQTEITNGQYQLFLDDLIKQGKTKEYEIAKIDTSLWNKLDISGAATYAKTYYKEKDFPVVNISKAGAILYCQWLTGDSAQTGPVIPRQSGPHFPH
jgi:formylglycine-generating enzyme required for sulfatase activity